MVIKKIKKQMIWLNWRIKISINFRVAFDEDRVPSLYDDQLVMQDIHSVPSLLKMYFRELPNPICTYHLYDKFVEAAKSSDDQRLGKYLIAGILREWIWKNFDK